MFITLNASCLDEPRNEEDDDEGGTPNPSPPASLGYGNLQLHIKEFCL